MRILKGGVGFFDSGIGGMTVLAECQKRCPGEFFYYYGDNKHAPYGNLPSEKIRRFVKKAFRRFRKLKVRAVVLACNTVTALCIDELRGQYSFPIIGAEPALVEGAKRGGEVFALVTRATYTSDRFQRLLSDVARRYPQSNVTAYPCDLLAGMIERHIFDPDFSYVTYFPKGTPNSVVLGCTHYIYIKEEVRGFYQCPVYDGNEGIAKRLCSILQKERIENKRSHKKPKKAKKKVEKKRFLRIFFLGSGKKGNKRLYEQMFAYKNR
ncbi:MAG: aspartate/glutamate racemase family protein [Clostridia bacterium]|nr:aspartate/glutamate racemase family protein [Clostridia bacterium]